MTIVRDNSDRRGSERFPAHLALRLQPVDANRQPVGEPIEAVSVDLSQSGICCVADRALLADYVIVGMQAAASNLEMRLLAQRIRCHRKGPLFEVALQFIEKLPGD